jgi:hypothetical protein
MPAMQGDSSLFSSSRSFPDGRVGDEVREKGCNAPSARGENCMAVTISVFLDRRTGRKGDSNIAAGEAKEI